MESRKKVVLYGCGDMGLQTYNILIKNENYEAVGFLDDNLDKKGSTYLGLPVWGDDSVLPELVNEYKVEGGVGTIGNNKYRREKNQIMKEAGLQIVSVIHPNAFIDNPEHIGEGSVIEMGAFIHPEVRIGEGCFVCCGAVVAHNSIVGKYALLGGGCVFGSRVVVGEYSLIGVGVNVSPYVTIGKNVLVGTGAAVIRDLPDDIVAAGVPAKILRDNV